MFESKPHVGDDRILALRLMELSEQRAKLQTLFGQVAELIAMTADDCALGIVPGEPSIAIVEEWRNYLQTAVDDGLEAATERAWNGMEDDE